MKVFTQPESVDIIPFMAGIAGKMWRVDLHRARLVLHVKPEDDATIAAWIIEAQWAHPAWHSYFLNVVHLRPMQTPRETKFYLDGATHEFVLFAMDPVHPREPAIRGSERPHLLRPVNFAAQFIAESDDLAVLRVEDSAKMICNGQLSPDTDFQRSWAKLWGDNMIKDEFK